MMQLNYLNLVIKPRLLRSALCIVLLSVSQLACTSSSLPPYEANYTTKLRGIRINTERQFLEIAENTYQLSWSAKLLLMRIKERSEFKIIDDKVVPISYRYTRKGLGSDRPIEVIFDWENMQAVGRKGDRVTNFALEPGTLDKLSFQVQMQLDLLNNREQTEFDYKIASHSGLRDYLFNYEKEEQLETKLGTFKTLVFRRDKKDSTIRLWMSPKQFYLPVKVQQTGDDANTLVIKSWKSERENADQDSPVDSLIEKPESTDEDEIEALEFDEAPLPDHVTLNRERPNTAIPTSIVAEGSLHTGKIDSLAYTANKQKSQTIPKTQLTPDAGT